MPAGRPKGSNCYTLVKLSDLNGKISDPNAKIPIASKWAKTLELAGESPLANKMFETVRVPDGVESIPVQCIDFTHEP